MLYFEIINNFFMGIKPWRYDFAPRVIIKYSPPHHTKVYYTFTETCSLIFNYQLSILKYNSTSLLMGTLFRWEKIRIVVQSTYFYNMVVKVDFPRKFIKYFL